MRCHTVARQVRRDVHLTACLAVALATLGCGSLPMVASKVEPAPFQDHDLAFLEAGSTDLATLTEELGPATIVLYNALKSGVWSLIRVATDEKPRRYLPEGTYCWFTAPPGRHAIRASFGPNCKVKQTRTFELDCEPARSYFLSLAGKTCSKTSITLEPEATARQALKERRLTFW